ncbi:MAG: beta-eliminating lyase-related protein, partial [Rickettsia endosymbiont of Ixodes persulcatus]|nr:beta-eliminating lyase-related protein [Rickettsia endosymbiont of Ixodes persulcatus]
KQVELYKYLKSYNINLHLDGARLFNSHVETNIALADYAKYTDTLSFCNIQLNRCNFYLHHKQNLLQRLYSLLL